MTSLLIFEPEATGHRSNYFNAFVGFARAHAEVGTVICAIGSELAERLAPEMRQALEAHDDRLRLRLLSPGEIASANRPGSKMVRDLTRWRMAIRIAHAETATALHFPLLDDVLIGAALMPATRLKISGIYFRPTMHFEERWKGASGYARQATKDLIVRRYLARPDTVAMLSYDAYFTSYAREHYRQGSKVHTLSEPIDAIKAEGQPVRARDPGQPVKFLMFGGLQRRKGVAELLMALAMLKPAYRPLAQFRICGEGEMSSLVRDRMPALREADIRIEFENAFLSEEDLEKRLSEADVFLAPYQRHIGSSGMVYSAAAYRRPIITQCSDLIGRQAKNYHLGESVDTANPAEIARAIERLTDQIRRGESDPLADYAGFIKGHGREAFARLVFEKSCSARTASSEVKKDEHCRHVQKKS
jgi:glycosyltransferase involved in cell wall biosynthesis